MGRKGGTPSLAPSPAPLVPAYLMQIQDCCIMLKILLTNPYFHVDICLKRKREIENGYLAPLHKKLNDSLEGIEKRGSKNTVATFCNDFCSQSSSAESQWGCQTLLFVMYQNQILCTQYIPKYSVLPRKRLTLN